MNNLSTFEEFLNEANRSKRDDGKIYFHELSDIDHTRLVKWMGKNLKAKVEDYDFIKGGKLKSDAYTLETSKMSERDLKDLLNYIDNEDYKFSTTIWLPAYIKEDLNEGAKILTKDLSREGEEFVAWIEKTMKTGTIKTISLEKNTAEITFNENVDLTDDMFNMVREWPNAPAYMDLYVDVMSVNRGRLVMMVYGKRGMSFTA
jgi:hypothetical protein